MDTSVEAALVIRDDLQRYGVEGMLRSVAAVRTVYCYTTPEQAARAAGENPPDLLVVSAVELGEPVARDTVAALCGRGVRLLVLVEPDSGADPSWVGLAHGVLDRTDLRPCPLREAVADVLSGRFHVPAGLARRLLVAAEPATPRRGPVAALTPRELQVLRLLADGLSNRQVAACLSISENGVKRLVGNVLAKLNSPNRTFAVVRAIEIGLLATARQASS